VGRRKVVYIAGPISRGDLCSNINLAGRAFRELASLGFAPVCPHWSCFSGVAMVCPTSGQVFAFGTADGNGMSHADWLAVDLEIVSRCDAVYRLRGESPGADKEVAHAESLGIPVFRLIDRLLAWSLKESSRDVLAG
jgi:hypothetical protein